MVPKVDLVRRGKLLNLKKMLRKNKINYSKDQKDVSESWKDSSDSVSETRNWKVPSSQSHSYRRRSGWESFTTFLCIQVIIFNKMLDTPYPYRVSIHIKFREFTVFSVRNFNNLLFSYLEINKNHRFLIYKSYWENFSQLQFLAIFLRILQGLRVAQAAVTERWP